MLFHTPDKIERFIFIEIENIQQEGIRIPGGKYLCKRTNEISIEEVSTLFSDVLQEGSSFLVIETVLFVSKYEIGKPTSELRVIEINQ